VSSSHDAVWATILSRVLQVTIHVRIENGYTDSLGLSLGLLYDYLR
jgi:hypothetical protein